jgi:hypothetical protein
MSKAELSYERPAAFIRQQEFSRILLSFLCECGIMRWSGIGGDGMPPYSRPSLCQKLFFTFERQNDAPPDDAEAAGRKNVLTAQKTTGDTSYGNQIRSKADNI